RYGLGLILYRAPCAIKGVLSLLGNQRLDKYKKGLGFNEYSAVPPPPAQVYSPPKKDLSWIGLPEFFDDTVTDYSRPTPSIDVSKDRNSWKPTVKYAEMYKSQRPRGNQRNWNNQKSQQLGSDFVMIKKACYTQERHEHDQEFDAEITTVGAEVEDIAAET
ncbi:hypothetical protein Tco_0511281, partial [Tanacetum coccineum]